MKIKLSQPITVKGTEVKELNLDFDKLTGNDIINASREAQLLGENIVVPEFSKQYLAIVAAKASGINVEDINNLPARDFTAITIAVQNFLLK